MGDNTAISWADATWNCVVGCTNCSAIRDAHRLVPERLELPLRWKRPRRVFVNSQADLFHPSLSFADIDQVFAVMAVTPEHTYQVLTKRPERMRAYMASAFASSPTVRCSELTRDGLDDSAVEWPLPNVWLGTSVEDQASADARIPHLLQTPAAVRFISAEPLLGQLDLLPWLVPTDELYDADRGAFVTPHELLDWIVAGGESGPGARPCDLAWLGALRDQCAAAGVPYFCKQLGAVWAREQRVKGLPADSHGGEMEWWPPALRVRQWPKAASQP